MVENYITNVQRVISKHFQWILYSILFGISMQVYAQQSFNYQAAVRDADGTPLANQTIGVQIAILQGSETGTNIYEEVHTVTSNDQGIIVLAIGRGDSSDSFSDIAWNTQNYWLQVGIDTNGGNSYSVLGTSPLLSVPFANYAIDGPDADPNNEIELPTGGTNGQVLITDGSGNYSWVNDNVNDADADATNEIELPTGGTNGQVLITDGSGNYSWVNDNVNDADADATNEIELPTGGTNGQVLITDGSGNYSWVNDNVNDADADATNEIELPTGGTNGQVLITDGSGNYSWVNDNVNDADADATNEIELPTGGTNGQVLITDGSGNYSWVNDNVNDADADATNEIELPTGGTNGQVLITDGSGNYSWVNDNVNDADADATNEIELPTGGTNGQVLITDGSGNYSWVNDNVNDADADATNEIELPTGGTNGQVLITDGSGNYSWVNDQQGAFSTTSNITSNANGTIATDDFVFGSSQLDDIASNTTDDIRMYFDKSKGSFRAGDAIDSDGFEGNWNTINTGNFSVVMGRGSIAQGTAATAFGSYNQVGGENAFAAGFRNLASRYSSIAIGSENSVSGFYAVGIGRGTQSTSYGQHTIGLFSEFVNGSNAAHIATDPLFLIGNGTDDSTRSNALVMLKNGNTTLNGQLTIDGDNSGSGQGYTLPAQDGTNNQIMTTDGSGNVSWTSPATGAFSTAANVTSNANGTIATDDFVFGSTQLDNDPLTTDDNAKMFFDKSKGAFRVGRLIDIDPVDPDDNEPGDQWDASNVGEASIVLGEGSMAAARNSVAIGDHNTINASSAGSVAIGNGNTINNSGISYAFGSGNTLTEGASMAFGFSNTSSAFSALAMGFVTHAGSYAQTSIGLNNTVVNGTKDSFNATDRLFVIGNGISVLQRRDALVMLKNGNTTLNGQLTIDGDNTGAGSAYTLPAQDGTANQVMTTDGAGNVSWTTLSGGGSPGAFSTTANITSNANGTIATDDFVFGSSQLNDIGGNATDNVKMYFDKSKGAFRAGSPLLSDGFADGWDAVNTGDYSVVMGRGSMAPATAATAFGTYNAANGENAFAVGYQNLASRFATVALGAENSVSGHYAVGIGRGAQSTSYGQHTIGLFSEYVAGSDAAYVATDPLFIIGNGVDDGNRTNALVMQKNGNTKLNGQLTIDADNNGAGVGYTLPGQDGTANQVMTTDGSGNVSWAAVSAGSTLPSGGTNGQVLSTNGSGNYSWVNDAVNDADSSPTNEIELPTGGTNGQVLITDGSGNYSWVNDNVNDADADATNEIELPTGGTNGQVLITDGSGNYSWVNDAVNDADSSPTNEIELPTGGTNGQVLRTDGSGNYSWVNDAVNDLDADPTNEIELPSGGTANSLLTTDGSGNHSWTNNVNASSVTTPALTVTGLPSFSADLNGTLVLSGAGSYVQVPTWRTSDATVTNLHDNGNHFDEATGTFTAPVNGLYFFSAQIRFDGITSGFFRLLIGIQGKSSLENGMHAIAEGDSGTDFHTLTVSGVMKLNANEKVNAIVLSSSDTDWSIQSESGFSGYLISRL